MSPSLHSSHPDSGDEEEEETRAKSITKPEEYPVSMLRIFLLNKKEWPYMLLGCIGSVIMGGSLPTFAIIFGEYFEVTQQ